MAEHLWPPPTEGHITPRCRVCGQAWDEAEAECPRSRDWNIPTRAQDRERQAEMVMMKLRPLVQRAQKLDVDRCEQCPFADMHDLLCQHSDAELPAHICEDELDDPAPEWCPIRGQVVLIGGPKAEDGDTTSSDDHRESVSAESAESG